MPRDTGFYEPFNRDRNTTLPHPEADTSGHASIPAGGLPDRQPATKSPHPFLHGKLGVILHNEIERLERPHSRDIEQKVELDGHQQDENVAASNILKVNKDAEDSSSKDQLPTPLSSGHR